MRRGSTHITLTDSNFAREVLENKQPIIVVFEADWSGTCHIIAPSLESLAVDPRGRMRIGRLNVDNNRQIPARYGIQEIPTLLLFKHGQMVGQIVGAVSSKELRDRIRVLL